MLLHLCSIKPTLVTVSVAFSILFKISNNSMKCTTVRLHFILIKPNKKCINDQKFCLHYWKIQNVFCVYNHDSNCNY